jgi:hypothetical protein
MSKQLTIVLTDEEFSLLETQAQTQRRSVREMAGFLVTRPQQFQLQAFPIGPAPINPIWPPNVWCGTTDATGTGGVLPDGSVFPVATTPAPDPTCFLAPAQ